MLESLVLFVVLNTATLEANHGFSPEPTAQFAGTGGDPDDDPKKEKEN